jgi:hypothetical protein
MKFISIFSLNNHTSLLYVKHKHKLTKKYKIISKYLDIVYFNMAQNNLLKYKQLLRS